MLPVSSRTTIERDGGGAGQAAPTWKVMSAATRVARRVDAWTDHEWSEHAPVKARAATTPFLRARPPAEQRGGRVRIAARRKTPQIIRRDRQGLLAAARPFEVRHLAAERFRHVPAPRPPL